MPHPLNSNKTKSGLFILAFAGMVFGLGANGLVLCRSLAEEHGNQATVERYCLKTPETHHPQDHHHDHHPHTEHHHQGDHHPAHESEHSHEHTHEEDCQDITLPSWAILRQLAKQDAAPHLMHAAPSPDSPQVFSLIAKPVSPGSLPPPPMGSGPLTGVVLLI